MLLFLCSVSSPRLAVERGVLRRVALRAATLAASPPCFGFLLGFFAVTPAVLFLEIEEVLNSQRVPSAVPRTDAPGVFLFVCVTVT